MTDSPFFFGDSGDSEQMANSGTAENILRKKFLDVPGNGSGIPLFNSAPPTMPASALADPSSIPAPDVGQPSAPFVLPWMRQFQQAQPQPKLQRPPMTTPTGQMVPGLTKGQKLTVLLKAGIQGAMAGRAASEQAVIQSGGRRSGGAGMGFEAGMEQPLIQATQQQRFQAGQMQNQLTQQQIAQTTALNQAYQAGTARDPETGAVTFDRSKVMASLGNSGQGALIPGFIQSLSAMDKAQGEVTAQRDKHAEAADNYVGAALQGIVKSKNPQTGQYDLATTGAVLAHIAQSFPQEAEQLRASIVANPSRLNQIVDSTISQSPSQQKLSNEAWKTVDGRLVNTQTGATMGEQLPVDQLNQGLTQRYQVLNPGKNLPASFTLPANATAKDFDRIDKLMQQTEQSKGTQAQRDQTAAIRQQTLSMAQQNQQDRQTKQGLQWVMWQDPESGRTVAGPLSLAQKSGAENPAALDTRDVQSVMDARQVVNMVNKKGGTSDPTTWGVLQLAQSLNKDGKMGVFTSRFNRLMTQGVGSEPGDDARIISLLDKGQLMTTLTMKSHFGATGGRSPQMLEHFEQLAQAGKMDGPTFINGTKAVADYMLDKSMMIPGQGGKAGGGGIQVTDPQGGIHTFPDQASAARFKKSAGIP
jgi:hypothetical protein